MSARRCPLTGNNSAAGHWNRQETVPIRELWRRHCSYRLPLFHCILYCLTKEQPTGRFTWCSEEDYCQYTDQLNHKFLNWWELQTHSRRMKKISHEHFKTSSRDAISSKETYCLIFQTTYPTAPIVRSKNFWMLSNFEDQEAWFGNKWTGPAETWWFSRRHAILRKWPLANYINLHDTS